VFPPGLVIEGRAGEEECDALSGRETSELAGVATDGTADTLKIDVASTDEHGVRWHDSRLLWLSGMSKTGSRVWDGSPLTWPVQVRLLRLLLGLVLAVAP
jgi:hypothetical protein